MKLYFMLCFFEEFSPLVMSWCDFMEPGQEQWVLSHSLNWYLKTTKQYDWLNENFKINSLFIIIIIIIIIIMYAAFYFHINIL